MHKKELKMANYLMNEEDEIDNPGVVKMFYENFDLGARTEILKAIDDALGERINIFEDDLVKAQIEEELSKKPIVTMTGEEIVNMMNFDF